MKKVLSASIVGALLMTGVSEGVHSVANAENVTQEQDVVSSKVQQEKQWQAFSPEAQDSFRYLVKANGYNNSQQMDLLRNTAAAKGIAKDGTSDRGKVGIAKSVIKQAWKTLPKNVKTKLKSQSRLWAAVQTVDQFTEDVENEIYNNVKGLGLDNNSAWVVTKAITLIIM
ncbi:hypothetical protein [Staphylococcus caeli]|uniref:Uncharacterized protein n=1 Tax=Staphylococcus caeli TaxID=2201815 RepID=A0A1D4PVD4_9STAP|nr:hypothetical protein [Staphylococcus caeli]SCT26873.1 Uncharacterised protein [Staphylococcus caeli]SCT34996.1 Uncharacterised protein [Staphylococcus caeli]